MGDFEQFRTAGIAAQLQYFRYLIEDWIDSQPLDKEAREYFLQRQEDSLPYHNYDLEPRQVAQVKKIINALYLYENAVEDLESSTISGNYILQQFQNGTIERIAEATRLITHPEFDLNKFFHENKAYINPLYKKFSAVAEVNQIRADKVMTQIQYEQAFTHAGQATGEVLAWMGSQTSTLSFLKDKQLLQEFIRKVQSVLDAIVKNLLKEENGKLASTVLHIKSEAEIIVEELSNVLNDGFSFNNFFKQLSALLALKKKLYHLGFQSGTLNDSIRNELVSWLNELKEKWNPKLLDILLRTEETLMLSPGTYFEKVLNFLCYYYEEYSPLVSSLIPQTLEGHERYMSLIDHQVVSSCVELSLKRLSVYEEKYYEVILAGRCWDKKWAKTEIEGLCLLEEEHTSGLMEVFSIEKFKNRYIQNMTAKEKETFSSSYFICQPYVRAVDPTLDALIVDGLKKEDRSVHFVTRLHKKGELDQLIALDKIIKQSIIREAINYKFIINLNQKQIFKFYQSLIDKIPKRLPLHPLNLGMSNKFFSSTEILRELNNLQGPLEKNENQSSHRRQSRTDFEKLKKAELLNLLAETKNKQIKLINARECYRSFVGMFKGERKAKLTALSYEKKKKLSNLYYYFREFLLERCFNEKHRFEEVDRQMSFVLNKPSLSKKEIIANSKPMLLVQNNEEIERQFSVCFHELNNTQLRLLSELEDLVVNYEGSVSLLENPVDPNKRYRVLKTEELSESISSFRTKLYNYISALSDPVQRFISPNDKMVPFPEMENLENSDAHSDANQVKAIKRLYNAAYYLEEIVKLFEGLDDRAWHESRLRYTNYYFASYLHNSWFILQYFLKLQSTLKEIALDPHYRFYANQLFKQFGFMRGKINEYTAPYFLSPENIIGGNETQINLGGVFKLINSIFYAPSHIKSLHYNFELAEEEKIDLSYKAKIITHQLEKLINFISSNPMIAVIFLSPSILNLYKKIRFQLVNLKEVSYEVAVLRLAEIRHELLSQTAIIIDEYESAIGLQSGVLSDETLKRLVEFFDGMLKPLNIKEDIKINCSLNLNWLDVRLGALDRKLNNSQEREQELSEKLEYFNEHHETLRQFIKSYKSLNSEKRREYISQLSVLYQEIQNDLQLYDLELTSNFIGPSPGLVKQESTHKSSKSVVLAKKTNEQQEFEWYQNEQNRIRILPIKRIQHPCKTNLTELDKLNKLEKALKLFCARGEGEIKSLKLQQGIIIDKRSRLLSFMQNEARQGEEKRKNLMFEKFDAICQKFVSNLSNCSKELKTIYSQRLISFLKLKRETFVLKSIDHESPHECLELLLANEYEKFSLREPLSAYQSINEIKTQVKELEIYIYLSKRDEDNKTEDYRCLINDKKTALDQLKYLSDFICFEHSAMVMQRLNRLIKNPRFRRTLAKSESMVDSNQGGFYRAWFDFTEALYSIFSYKVNQSEQVLHILTSEVFKFEGKQAIRHSHTDELNGSVNNKENLSMPFSL